MSRRTAGHDADPIFERDTLGWLLADALQWLVLYLVNISLPAPYSPLDLGLALIGTLVLAVLVVAGPLRRATRLRPGDAIRYN